MTFSAHIIRFSAVWRLWRDTHRVGGVVAGVHFRWVQGDNYVSGELAPAQVTALKDHASVRLEACDMPMPVVEVDPSLPDDAAEPRQEGETILRTENITKPLPQPLQTLRMSQPQPQQQHQHQQHKGNRR